MALTLDPILQAAQDGTSHRPIVSIVSSATAADIPLAATLLTSETFDETRPAVIALSTGRLATAYLFDDGSHTGITLTVTDTARTTFTATSYNLYTHGTATMQSVAICELTTGNLGLLYLVNDTTNSLYRLRYKTVTVAGAAVGSGEIATWSNATATSLAACITLADDSFLAVYAYQTGSDWSFYKRTSSNFTTWSAASALSIAGLTSTKRLANPDLLQIDNGDLLLTFDVLDNSGAGGEELTNIYQSISADDGATWGTATAITAYTDYAAVALDPCLIQRATNTVDLAYTIERSYLRMTKSASGWPSGSYTDHVRRLQIDATHRTAYVRSTITINRGIECIVKLDLDTWQVLQAWDASSTPALPLYLTDGSSVYPTYRQVASGSNEFYLEHFSTVSGDVRGFILLDGESNTLTAVNFDDYPTWGITANCTGAPDNSGTGDIPVFSRYDSTEQRVYLLFANSSPSSRYLTWGYVDLTGGAPYAFTTSWATAQNYISETDAYSLHEDGRGGVFFSPTDDLLIISPEVSIWSDMATLRVFVASTGAEIATINHNSTANFPYYGLRGGIYYASGKIYGGTLYSTDYGQGDNRGLCVIDIASETVGFLRPSYASLDEYDLRRLIPGQSGKLLMTGYSGVGSEYGVVMLEIATETWTLYSDATLPDAFGDSLGFTGLAYDPANDMILTGGGYSYSGYRGVTYFSIYGNLKQLYLSAGTYSGGVWGYAAAQRLTLGNQDQQVSLTKEPDSTGAYFFWDAASDDLSEDSVAWGKDGGGLELLPYLLTSADIAVKRDIASSAAELSFEVSHGHLFDPYNQSSLLAPILKKGRKLTLRLGETVSGVDYWQTCGTFFVTATSGSFQRGSYPSLKVTAQDQRAIWWDGHVTATDAYNSYPDVVLDDLLVDLANMDLADIDMPTFANQVLVEHQWIDTSLGEVITQICHRFGYFFTIGQDGKARARRISDSNSVDHVYSDLGAVISWSPDDRYSDFTNQVTVVGQERNYIDVLFPEERVGELNGTCGWWGFKNDFQIWFSDDRSKRVQKPRLVVNETAQSIGFTLAGGITESIADSSADPTYPDRYCTVTVEAPNLAPALAVAIAAWAAAHYYPDEAPPMGGPTFPVGRAIESASLLVAMNILASMGNYQYEIWGQPVGEVRRQVSATYDDTDHQTEIGRVVTQRLEDPLCYSEADCLVVATYEAMVVRLQRRRVKLTKIAHLQDEEGDTIQLPHPISGQTVSLFITTLNRRLKRGQDGGVFDDIEGWIV